jgi:hypothetical protein
MFIRVRVRHDRDGMRETQIAVNFLVVLAGAIVSKDITVVKSVSDDLGMNTISLILCLTEPDFPIKPCHSELLTPRGE